MVQEQQQQDSLRLGGNMTKYYSASSKGFYSKEVHGSNIPDDAVEITDDEWLSLLEGQSEGKIISSDSNGRPILIDQPAPTKDELISMGIKEKERLIAEATVKIAPFQDAEDLDMATPEEKSSLMAWKKYRVLLNRVDTSLAPDITWPQPPSV